MLLSNNSDNLLAYRNDIHFDIESLEESFNYHDSEVIVILNEMSSDVNSMTNLVIDCMITEGEITDKVKQVSITVAKNTKTLSSWMANNVKWMRSYVVKSSRWAKNHKYDMKNKLDNNSGFSAPIKKYDLNILDDAVGKIDNKTNELIKLGNKALSSGKLDNTIRNDFNVEAVLGMTSAQFKERVYKGRDSSNLTADEIVSNIVNLEEIYKKLLNVQSKLIKLSKKLEQKAKGIKDDKKLLANVNSFSTSVMKITTTINLVNSRVNAYLKQNLRVARRIMKLK